MLTPSSRTPGSLPRGRRPPRGGLRLPGIVSGVLAGAVGVCVGYLVAPAAGSESSPLAAVASAAIDLSPESVKNAAIRTFGQADKLALEIGVLAVLAVVMAGIGLLARRRLAVGLAGVGVLAVIAMIAAGTRPAATAAYPVPSVVAAGAAGVTLAVLTIIARRTEVPERVPVEAAATGDGPHDAAAPSETAPSETAPSRTARIAAGTAEHPRRDFVIAGTVAAGAAAAAYLGGRLLTERAGVTAARRSLRLPSPASPAPPVPGGADLAIPGLSRFITPNSVFYRVDTAVALPEIDPAAWRLRIHGMVERELTLSFAELLKMPLIEDLITLTCVSNPVGGPYVGNARWLGVSLRSLLRSARIRAGADQLFCTSTDGFTSGTPVQTAMDGRDALLAVGMNGSPLPVAHGFPVRLVVPGLYGYVSACKWVTDIEVTTYADNVAYWAQRGWSARAPIKTESRIEVPSGRGRLRPGPTVVAGQAWAPHRGIDAVEVRMDGGPWRQARLAPVPGIDCWRQWHLRWDLTPGQHLIQARATDGTGYTQTGQVAPPEPDGATGYPSVTVTVASD